MTKDINEYLDDDKRIKKLQKLVDEVCEKIKSGKLTLGEAKKEAALVRLKARSLYRLRWKSSILSI